MGFLKRLSNAFRKRIQTMKEAEADMTWMEAHLKLVRALYQQQLVENALNVGDKIPITELQTIVGERFQVKELLEKGPIILKFHRGSWCEYCRADLEYFNKFTDMLRLFGATPIAISTQLAEKSREVAKANGFKFHMVSDAEGEISRKFGVAFQFPEEITRYMVARLGIDFTQFYHKNLRVCSLPATYVIDRHGFVTYAFLDEDYRNRANVEEVMRFVRKAKLDRWNYFLRCEEEDKTICSFAKGLSKKLAERRASCKSQPRILERIGKKKSHHSLHSASQGSRESDLDEGEEGTRSSAELAKDPLQFCLQSDEFLASFKSYLGMTFCTENLLFYTEGSHFHDTFATLALEDQAREARRIFETFVKVGAELEVNIDDVTREEIAQRFEPDAAEPIDAELFSKAVREVYRLMEDDSFTKWRRTRDFSRVWKKHGSLRFLSPLPEFAAEAA